METAYAMALWKMVAEGMDAKKAVHALIDVLAKNGRSSLTPRIARAFLRIAQRQLRKDAATLTVARDKDERYAKAAVKDVLEELGIVSKDLKTQVDDTLIGGWRLEAKGTLVDASYKKQLIELYNRSTA
ncbi:MAG: F0F1 ATP synthase subunit delta [bacterium]|nr:F0F1 ATP synthase subunit delta [bacterium]